MNVASVTAVVMFFSHAISESTFVNLLSWLHQKLKLQGTGCTTGVRTASNRKTDNLFHSTDV